VAVAHEVICDESEAVRWGVRGSPTLLIAGADPFAEAGQPPSMSCRLHRDDNGRPSGAPSAAQLRQAIEQALAAGAPPTDPAWLDPLGRSGRSRVAPAEQGLRGAPGRAAIVPTHRGRGHVGSLSPAGHRPPGWTLAARW
jgi:hypothetical protein